MVRVISDAAVADLLDLEALLPVVADAFRAQRAGAVERPERPHFPVGTGLDDADPGRALGTGLAMPAYVHGAERYATKLASVHEENPDHGLPTVHAQVLLTDAATGRPESLLGGTTITNARTGCIGGLAVAHLGESPAHLAVFGAGTQARWQTRAVAAATDLASVAVYSPSDSKTACASDLADLLDADVRAASTPADALDGANAVVTATTSTEPVFDAADCPDGVVVVAVGAYTEAMCELDAATVERASRLYADVPEEAVETGDLAGRRSIEELRPFADSFDDPGVASDELVVVESVGSAVLDAATAAWVDERARDQDVGERVPL
ncbi:ornithine cyclodeaminase family protein [Halorubellus sp. JP-L1]|uniref:ornithine cyclodeaminase family protein n=1 Tax=Halorubellus sp. JP-L1 TaxID=2715753 RepID=UPI001407D82E|nr:ornithine cyclodeaminase family protein [Halorubellus sp. JP-L1]NHN40396.1 ornithine cyclodeaminase family protein [Halorubellus sp. JP-L1]